MTTVFADISKQFGKSLILGALLPATIFVIVGLVVVVPLLPPGLLFLRVLEVFGTTWEIIAVSFLTVVLTGLLYNFNIPIVRLYEGYTWLHSYIGKRRREHYKQKYGFLNARRNGLFVLTRAMKNHPNRAELVDEWNRVTLELHQKHPRKASLVLPTRLGNQIRSFENYAKVQYNFDAIELWPRLIAVLDKDYGGTIDNARTSFNFMLNLSLLCGVLALATGIVGLIYPPPAAFLRVVLPVVVLLGLARWFYKLSVGRAYAWGELVKGAFDLYRRRLLEQLGYEQKPKTRGEERALWREISLQMMIGDRQMGSSQTRPRVDYAEPSVHTAVHTEPDEATLQVTRGIEAPWWTTRGIVV